MVGRVTASQYSKRLKPRIVSILPLVLFLIGACALRAEDPEPVVRLRYLLFDTYQRLKSRIYDPAIPVRIVDIDDRSIAEIGQWPWPRSTMADLVSRLKEARAGVIAFDAVFPEPDRLSPRTLLNLLPKEAGEAIAQQIESLPTNDEQFANAIRGAPVVLGMIGTTIGQAPIDEPKATVFARGSDPREYLPHFEGAVRSLPALTNSAAGEGILNWTPEFDQVVRRLPLLAVIGQRVWPSIAAETLRLPQEDAGYATISPAPNGWRSLTMSGGIARVMVGGVPLPVDASGQLWIHHTPHDARRYISAYRLLRGDVDASELQGKIVFVGTSAAGLQDTRTTPLDDAIPGIEIQAEAVEQMLLGDHLFRPGILADIEIGATAIGSLILIVIVASSSAAAGAIACGLSVTAAFTISWIAYSRYGLLADAVYPSGVFSMVYIIGTARRYFSTEAERNRVRRAFGYYLSPALVEELARDPSRLKLSGEMRPMTVLFSDVRNFTEISEKLDAIGLTAFLNRLLTPLSDTILSLGGTIDKYIGDAIMAFWNAPLPEPFHARRAALAALRMQDDVKRLNEVLANEAKEAGASFRPVMIGIGLNTGPCCVGNLGTPQRFDYSVIGDTVNVASRLEGQSKVYGVGIIAGSSVAEAAPDLAFLQIDVVKVKGRNEPIRIYTLIGDEHVKEGNDFKELEALHRRGLEAFLNEDFPVASHLFSEAAAIAGPNLKPLYSFYRQRMAQQGNSPALLDADQAPRLPPAAHDQS